MSAESEILVDIRSSGRRSQRLEPSTRSLVGLGGGTAAARVQASGLSVLRCNRATGEVVVDMRALALDGGGAS